MQMIRKNEQQRKNDNSEKLNIKQHNNVCDDNYQDKETDVLLAAAGDWEKQTEIEKMTGTIELDEGEMMFYIPLYSTE